MTGGRSAPGFIRRPVPAMPLRVSNLRLSVDEPETTLRERLARVLGLSAAEIDTWRILRKSLDARDAGALSASVVSTSTSWPRATSPSATRCT